MMKLAQVLKEMFNKRTITNIITPILLLSCQKKLPSKFEHLTSDFDKMTQNYLKFNVPTITIDELDSSAHYLLIDCRSSEEYSVSTINGAINIEKPSSAADILQKYNKDNPIVVFCSIGYRSEKMTNSLIKLGYKNTNNLYGSIFEWANRGLPLHNKNKPTDTIHTYNRNWSKWITNKQLTKTW